MNAATPPRVAPEGAPPGKEAHAFEQKTIEAAKIALPVTAVVIAGIAGTVQGPSSAILVLAGGALIGVITIFWASVRTLLGETQLSGADAYALGAPRVEEEQKRAVLRALKDLEFERSVGKISDEDYQSLVTKYRAEAKRLLRLLDAEAQPRRDHVEALVTKRLRREGLLSVEPAVEPAAAEASTEDAESDESAATAEAPNARARGKKRKKARTAAETSSRDAETAAKAAEPSADSDEAEAPTQDLERSCAACGTMNDPDAIFCKKCGTRRAPTEATAVPATTVAPSQEPSQKSQEEEAS